VCDQETSKNEEAKARYWLWKIKPQRVVTPRKQTNNKQVVPTASKLFGYLDDVNEHTSRVSDVTGQYLDAASLNSKYVALGFFRSEVVAVVVVLNLRTLDHSFVAGIFPSYIHTKGEAGHFFPVQFMFRLDPRCMQLKVVCDCC
jgi:hypothetical protein